MPACDVSSRRRTRFLAGLCGLLLLGLSQIARAAEPPITALAFDPAETELLAGSQQGITRLTWPELKRKGTLDSELMQVQDLRFSTDGKTLAIAGGTPGEEGAVELWSWPERKLQATHAVHSDVIYQLAWSADSERIFTASHDAGVLEIQAASGKILRSFSGHSQPVRALCLLEDQETLVSAGNDQTIRVWNTKTGQLARALNNHTNAVLALAERPRSDNSTQLPMIASIGADTTVRLWQPTIGRMVRFLRLPASMPLALVWSSDGESLLITLKNGELIFLNPDTLELQPKTDIQLREPLSLVLQHNGKRAAIGGKDGKVKVVPLD